MASIAQPLPKPVIKSSTMASDVIQKVLSVSLKAIEENYSDRDIAASIRKAFQSAHSTSTWHCFVGRDLGCYVTHKEGCYIYLYIGQLGICLFAT
mmetsp:Transcript_9001/g.16484  ORF Transcript_9001/g.16484 Transcript_9001/m.16484 type:complete len:95 (+) Transcript_9001:164-448(+)